MAQFKQTWNPGDKVKAGFMALTVLAKIPTPGDGLPDKYLLVDRRTAREYYFTPYNGIERVEENGNPNSGRILGNIL